MRLLLDTHIVIWWFQNLTDQLSTSSYLAISGPKNQVFVSAASVWEIAIKQAKGKLDAPEDIEPLMVRHRFESLPIVFSHARVVRSMPFHHDDPFDRILVAQAMVEGLTLITRDTRLKRYNIPVILA